MPLSPKAPRGAGLLPGVTGHCPQCGKGKLFNGFLTLAPKCDSCGLDYGFADSGDGPTIFIMMISGILVIGSALLTDSYFEPPLWALAVIFLPLMAVVSLGLIRPTKGLLIASQYRHRAEQGRRES